MCVCVCLYVLASMCVHVCVLASVCVCACLLVSAQIFIYRKGLVRGYKQWLRGMWDHFSSVCLNIVNIP